MRILLNTKLKDFENIINSMAFRRWCEISPWDKEDECLDMSSFEKESLNLIKKHSSVIVQARIESRIFSNQ